MTAKFLNIDEPRNLIPAKISSLKVNFVLFDVFDLTDFF